MKKIRKTAIRRASRIHGTFTLALFIAYVLAGSFLDPVFLVSDIKNRSAWAASNFGLTQRIYDVPVRPALAVQSSCNGGSARVVLDWDDDENASSFDIYRNGEELITALAISDYTDSNVNTETSYDYYVTARGPAGESTSEIARETIPSCQGGVPEPVIEITSFQGGAFSGIPKITDRTPAFSGTVNIPYAIIDISIHSSPVISARTIANANGYWSWTSPVKLAQATHTIYITATDPEDETRKVYVSQIFKITEEEDDGEDEKKKASASAIIEKYFDKKNAEEPKKSEDFPLISEEVPFRIDLEIKNDGPIYSRQSLLAQVIVYGKGEKILDKNVDFSYSIIDHSGKNVMNVHESRDISGISDFNQELPLSKLDPGKHKLLVEAKYGNFSISTDKVFEIKEAPVFNLGAGFTVSASQIINNLGWLLMVFLVIFLICLLLVMMENLLSRTGLVRITEKELARRGFISRRKGVSG